MLPILALATLAITPVLTFTSDSVYKNDNVIDYEIVEHYEEDVLISSDMQFKERQLLGYTIYDDPSTPYIDGLKFDDAWVYDWCVKGIDVEAEHSISIKTVYTDDFAGMLMAAKDGNWILVLSNPVMLIQAGYYILAAISLIVGGVGLIKAKKAKIKDHNQIAASVKEIASSALENITEKIDKKIDAFIEQRLGPVVEAMGSKIQTIVEAFVLSQSSGKDSKLALIQLLKNSSSKDISEVTKTMEETVIAEEKAKEEAKEEAIRLVNEISEGNFEPEEDKKDSDIGGLAI